MELSQLNELEELDLRANRISHFPIPPEAFRHLRRLDLSFNRLPDAEVERIKARLAVEQLNLNCQELA